MTPADAKRWWARITAGCHNADIALLSDATYWDEVRETNEAAAKAGDLAARQAIADCDMFELCRPALEEQKKTLRGTWTNIRGEALIRTAKSCVSGDVVTVKSMKGQMRRYTLTEMVEPGIWQWKGR